ncbi:MAG: zinc ribbon domain-containing protein [Dehalococcoidia bacterium]
MAIYEYECPRCGERFELRRSMTSSDHDVKCPKCGTEKPRRVFSSFGTASGKSCAPSSPT